MVLSPELERCKKYLRSTLIANKGGVASNEVSHQYYETVGEHIPFSKFGHQSLESFLKAIPDVCEISWAGRQMMVMAVASKATEHIDRMVAAQQSSKKGSKSRKPANHGMNGAFPFGSNYPSRRPPALATKSFKRSYHVPPPSSRSSAFHYAPPMSKPPPQIGIKRGSAPPVFKQPPRIGTKNGSPVSSKAPGINTMSMVPSNESSHVFPDTKGGESVYGGRVMELLQGREKGIFVSQVEKLYQKKWQENLPKYWHDQLEKSRRVKVSRNGQTNIVIAPIVNGDTTEIYGNGHWDAKISLKRVNLPSNSEWDIKVCSVQSTNKIHIWLGDPEYKLIGLHSEMSAHYRTSKKELSGKQVDVKVGEYYCAMIDNNNDVRRVKVKNLNMEKRLCTCVAVDYGDELLLEWSQLAQLNAKFADLPAQAIEVSLAGVEAKVAVDEVRFVRHYLLGRRLVGVFIEALDEIIVSLVLFDTSQGDEDIMVSEEIIKHLKSGSFQTKSTAGPYPRAMSLVSPPYPSVGDYYDLVVSHILNPQEFYVQSHANLPVYSSFAAQLSNFYEKNGSHIPYHEVIPGSVVAVKVSNSWLRAKVIRSLSTSLVSLLLVDIGRIVICSKTTVKPLVKQFDQLPAQCIKAKMSDICSRSPENRWDEESIEWFKHVALGKSLVGLVKAKTSSDMTMTLYDTSVPNVDTIINKEIVSAGLAILNLVHEE